MKTIKIQQSNDSVFFKKMIDATLKQQQTK